MNQITKKKHRRSRPFRMSFLVGALFCAFLTTTERAFSEIPVIAADLAWVAPSVLLASEDFDSVTPPVPPPGWSSTTPVTSSAAVRTPTPRPRPTTNPSLTPTPTPSATQGLPLGGFSLTGTGRKFKGIVIPYVDVFSIHVNRSTGIPS